MKASMRLLVLACTLITLPQLVDAATNPAGIATRYKWKDSQGGAHFSDTLPPEALQMGYDVVDAQGLVIRHVDRPRTVEERKADAAAAAAREEAKQRTADKVATDRLLLVSYPNESDLARVHQDRLDAVDQALKNVQVSLADQEKGLSEQLAHAATFERDSKPIPSNVKQQIETLRKTIANQTAFIARREKERADLIKQSDAEMAHYRELRSRAQANQ